MTKNSESLVLDQVALAFLGTFCKDPVLLRTDYLVAFVDVSCNLAAAHFEELDHRSVGFGEGIAYMHSALNYHHNQVVSCLLPSQGTAAVVLSVANHQVVVVLLYLAALVACHRIHSQVEHTYLDAETDQFQDIHPDQTD